MIAMSVSTSGIGWSSIDRRQVRQFSKRKMKVERTRMLEHISMVKSVLRTHRYTYWDASIASNPPTVHYDEIMADDKGVGAWTTKIVS